MVPLSIVYDKTKLNKDGSNICYLDGYGAYGISTNPFFNTYMLPMLKRGVVYAYAHVRGGGEKGDDWYKAGWKKTKPNTWKDFIACGEYLVNNGYTSKEKLAGTGTSAGGILIGRAITERPDLFKVAIPQVGSLNTVRAELSPNGPVNVPEFGTVKIEEEYRALKEMDSYLHLTPGVKYPATLITTGFNDPRVISWIPGKFAGKMQSLSTSENPVLLHVDYSTGHFGGETMSDYFKNLSDIYSFILWQCGDPDFQPKAN
jgi:prolyl oligopeptidase